MNYGDYFLFFSLMAMETNYFFDLKKLFFHFLAKFYQLIVTQWKPNIEIWQFFLFFLSYGDWNQLFLD